MFAMLLLVVLNLSFIKCQVSCLESGLPTTTCCICSKNPVTYNCIGECRSDFFEAPNEPIPGCHDHWQVSSELRGKDTTFLTEAAAIQPSIRTCLPCDRACASCASPDPRNCTKCAAGYIKVPDSFVTFYGIRCIALTHLKQHTIGVASPPPKSPDFGQTGSVFAISLTLAIVTTFNFFIFYVFWVYFRHRLRNMRVSRCPKYPPPPVPRVHRQTCNHAELWSDSDCDQIVKFSEKGAPRRERSRSPRVVSFWAKLLHVICCFKKSHYLTPNDVPKTSRLMSSSTKRSSAPNSRVEEVRLQEEGLEEPLYAKPYELTPYPPQDHDDLNTITTVVELQHPAMFKGAISEVLLNLTSASFSLQSKEGQEVVVRRQECFKGQKDERNDPMKPRGNETDYDYQTQTDWEEDGYRSCYLKTGQWSSSGILNISSEMSTSGCEGRSRKPVGNKSRPIFSLNMSERRYSMSTENSSVYMQAGRRRRRMALLPSMRRCSSDTSLESSCRTHNRRSFADYLSLVNYSSPVDVMYSLSTSAVDGTDTASFLSLEMPQTVHPDKIYNTFRGADIILSSTCDFSRAFYPAQYSLPFLPKHKEDRGDGNLLKTYTVTSGTQTASSEPDEVSPPVLGPRWGKKQEFSYSGSFLREKGSDVCLRVPVGAVEKATSVEVHAFISTDLDAAYRAMPVPGDEYIISPVAEYFAGHDFLFLEPVHVTLPIFPPAKVSENEISVYSFSRHVLGHIELTKLRLQSKDNTDRDHTLSGTYYFAENNKIVVILDHFSGCFCTCKAELLPQHLHLLVFGNDSRKAQGGRQVYIRLEIWDNRLDVKDFEKEVYEKRTVSAVHLHYIDKKILSVPEEDCELDKVYVGLQLELKSEEDQRLWKHCTRINGDPIFPAIQRVKLKSVMACSRKCQRTAFPKTVDWKLATGADEETPADDFECLVDHGYVMLEEGAVAATGPLHFVSDWQTFDIRVGQSMVVVDNQLEIKDNQTEARRELGTRALPGAPSAALAQKNNDTTDRKQILSHALANGSAPPNVVNSTFRSGSMEGAVGDEEVDVSETGSVCSLRSGDLPVAITNARYVNISMSHTMPDVCGSSATEAPEPGTSNQFAPRMTGEVSGRFNNDPGHQYSLADPRWTDNRRAHAQRTPGATAAAVTGVGSSHNSQPTSSYFGVTTAAPTAVGSSHNSQPTSSYPDATTAAATAVGSSQSRQPASSYPDALSSVHEQAQMNQVSPALGTSPAASSTLHSDYVELPLPVQVTEQPRT